MANTCLAYDHSAPEDVQQAIRVQLKVDCLDSHDSCLLKDLEGRECSGDYCAYGGPEGRKTEHLDRDRKYKEWPKPLSLAAKRQAPKRKAAPRRKAAPKRKAKKGRRK